LFCTHGADGLPIIKVLDFGISKLGPTTVDGAMTGKHAIIGSPRYMSPEQFSSPADVDHRTDIWALGVILYEVVTGVAPFVGDTLFAIWERAKAEIPKPIQELRRDAPQNLGAVILRCLEKERANRFQNVAELAKALLPFAPERSRGSVARIVRIVESPGVSTASLSLPPSGPAPASTATSVSISSEPQLTAKPRRTGIVVAALLAVVVVGAVALREVPKPRAEQAATPAPTAPTRPEPALEKLAPSDPVVALGTASAPTVAPVAVASAAARPAVVTHHAVAPTAAAPSLPKPAVAEAVAVPTLATPIATPPAAAPSASSTAAMTRTTPSGTPWIVDIVEKRRSKPGEVP
jgi:serine/threonine-protein kinase